MFKLLCGALVAVFLSACAPNYSDGVRVGVITKLSNKGLIWKSYEGSMNQGGTKVTQDSDGNSQTVPNAFNFNAANPTVIRQLQEAMESGARVRITYTQWFFPPLNIDNSRVIVKVE